MGIEHSNQTCDLQDDSPREITAQEIATIPKLDSEGQLNDLIENIDRNIELVKLREYAQIRAQRLENLRKADQAPRCRHLKFNGRRCGAPAITGQIYCHFHRQAVTPVGLEFPVIEDARSFQIAMMRVCQQIANGAIQPAQAKVLLQALELAEENIRTNGGLNYAGKADVPWDLAPITQWIKEPE